MVETKAKNGVTRFDKSEIHRHVCAGTGVWLHVGVICAKQFLYALNCQRFNIVNYCVASVVALAWVALCIFVCENRTSCFHHIW